MKMENEPVLGEHILYAHDTIEAISKRLNSVNAYVDMNDRGWRITFYIGPYLATKSGKIEYPTIYDPDQNIYAKYRQDTFISDFNKAILDLLTVVETRSKIDLHRVKDEIKEVGKISRKLSNGKKVY